MKIGLSVSIVGPRCAKDCPWHSYDYGVCKLWCGPLGIALAPAKSRGWFRCDQCVAMTANALTKKEALP